MKRSIRAGLLAAGAASAGLALVAVAPIAAASPTYLYVSAQASSTGAGTSCATANYTTIAAALAAAAVHNTILVCPGNYPGGIVLDKDVSLVGRGGVIDANGSDVGVQVLATGASVRSLVIRGATGEGILVGGQAGTTVAGATIMYNIVLGNDLGNPTGAALTGSPYAECNGTPAQPPAPAVPGDCGEGIHLMSAVGSVVADNQLYDNAGGILITDELGPSHNNVIRGNTVSYNTLDCGITVASHNSAGFANGAPVPAAGGVYDNKILRNNLVGNGLAGQGAGILLASPLPGGAVYNNTVSSNVLEGNGLGGITIHSHAPGQDLNGNVLADNVIGANNVDGDYDFSPHVDPVPTGIIVATAGPLAVSIMGNKIDDNGYGIWQTGPVTITGLSSNQFVQVGQHDKVG